jgi:hypothetical protein
LIPYDWVNLWYRCDYLLWAYYSYRYKDPGYDVYGKQWQLEQALPWMQTTRSNPYTNMYDDDYTIGFIYGPKFTIDYVYGPWIKKTFRVGPPKKKVLSPIKIR